MNHSYVQGFIDKCAAAGVDAEALVKWAGEFDLDRSDVAKVQAGKQGPTYGLFKKTTGSEIPPQAPQAPAPAPVPAEATKK